MKQILIATTNPGKIITIKKILARLGFEGLSFADLNLSFDEPEETKLTADEIAAEKALFYAERYKDLPVLSRDDTNALIGVDEEDDPKNHNKEFVIRKKGEYTVDKGTEAFAEVAHKYGGSVPARFDWGYALAWHENGETKVVSGLATADTDILKIVDQISPVKSPGYCMAPVLKVLVDGVWKYDSELGDENNWKTYWKIQSKTIEDLIKQCDLLD